MIDRAQRVVARHPEFAFAHDVLACGLCEAAQEIDVPDRAKAMSEAAWREANTDSQARSPGCGAYAILSDSCQLTITVRAKRFCCAASNRQDTQRSRLADYIRPRAGCWTTSDASAKS